MIKARAQVGKADAVILGLTRENVDRLMKGQPIMFSAGILGISEFDRVIVLGADTMADLYEDLRAIGVTPT